VFGSVVTTGIAVLCSAFVLAEGILRSATLLHTSILKSGLRAPMSFFDSTPIGRIINRFSKDIDVVDSQLPRSLHSWVVCALSVMGTIGVICYSTPMFLVIILPISIIYYFVQVQFPQFPSVCLVPLFNPLCKVDEFAHVCFSFRVDILVTSFYSYQFFCIQSATHRVVKTLALFCFIVIYY